MDETLTWLEAEQRADEADRLADLLVARIGTGHWPPEYTRGAEWAVRQLRRDANDARAYATTIRRRAL